MSAVADTDRLYEACLGDHGDERRPRAGLAQRVRGGNRFVVDRLVERVNATLAPPRSYAVVHADTGDARGIDVAFIYDDTLFQVPLPLEESVFFHVVMRRHATREIVQVNFRTTTTAAARTWAVFGN